MVKMETKKSVEDSENQPVKEYFAHPDVVAMDNLDSQNSRSPGYIDEEANMAENQQDPPANLTNFSIIEILKPEFGVKKFSVRLPTSFAVVNKHITTSTTTCRTRESHPRQHLNSSGSDSDDKGSTETEKDRVVWPAWVYCTRYSDRPSSGPRNRKIRRKDKTIDEKRPRTAFSNEQLQKLKKEFEDCRYLTEQRRKELALRLCLSESQIKIWFQNKRAKIKKTSGLKNPLALHLMSQGLYNHRPVNNDNTSLDVTGTL